MHGGNKGVNGKLVIGSEKGLKFDRGGKSIDG
jgi:hypothetical protein